MSLTVTIKGFLGFRVILPYIKRGKIILHGKALHVSGFLYLHIDRRGGYISLFKGNLSFLQHIITNWYMVNPMGFCSGNGRSIGVQLQVSVIIVLIAADPGCINIPLKVCSFIIGKGEPLSIQFCFIERQRCSLNLLLGSHIYLCDFSLGKLILKEIFLNLLCILQYQSQILSLYITPVIRNRFFLKDIGPNRQPCDGVDTSGGFRFSIRIRTAVRNP